MNKKFTLIGLLAACLFVSLPAHAQLVTLSTTITSAAITASDKIACLTSGTGVVTPGLNGTGSVLFIDREPMQVLSAADVSGCYNVKRPKQAYAHASGAPVYHSKPGNFYSYSPGAGGSCTTASMFARPWINTAAGEIWDCVGSKFTRVNEQTVTWCGTTNTCANTNGTNSGVRVVAGTTAALNGASPAVATVTGITPAFTSTSSYTCTGSVNSTAANTVVLAWQAVSGSSFTFTGPNAATATVSYVCVGH